MTNAVLERLKPGHIFRTADEPIAFKFFTRQIKALKVLAGESPTGQDEYYLQAPASSTVTDRMGDVISVAAQKQMGQAAKRLTIFLNHSYDVPEDIFGTCEESYIAAVVDEEQGPCFDLWIRVRITNPAENERAMKTWRHIADGARLGFSVGGQILEYKVLDQDDDQCWPPIEILSIDLYEISVVGIPANQRAVIDDVAKGLRKKLGLPMSKEQTESQRKALARKEQAEPAPAVQTPAAEPASTDGSATPSSDELKDAAAIAQRFDRRQEAKIDADAEQAQSELADLRRQIEATRGELAALTAGVEQKRLEQRALEDDITRLSATPLGRKTVPAGGSSSSRTPDPQWRRTATETQLLNALSSTLAGKPLEDARLRSLA